MKTDLTKLNDLDFLKELGEKKLQEIHALSQIREFKKGTLLYKPGDQGSVYIIDSGRVELYEIAEGGKKFIHSILKKGRICGDFDLEIPSTIYAEVIDDAEIRQLKTKDFINFLLGEPRLLLNFFKYFFIRLLILQRKAASIATDDVMRRLIKLLIQLARPSGTGNTDEYITDKYTHEQLSQMLGVSRQTITTTINILQRKNLLKRKKKAFVYEKDKLIQMAG